MATEIESSLIAFAGTHDESASNASSDPQDASAGEKKGKRNSNSKHNPSFNIRPQPTLLKVWQMANTAFIGLIPTFACIISPGRGDDVHQAMFWHDTVWLIIVGIFGLGCSWILWLIRVPSRYRISRSRLHIVRCIASLL
jgi:hypothetical protein